MWLGLGGLTLMLALSYLTEVLKETRQTRQHVNQIFDLIARFGLMRPSMFYHQFTQNAY